MRVTNSTILRNYDRNLKRLGKNKFKSEQKIYSGRSFSRASENPLNAAKALTIRKQLYHTSQYKENLQVADKFYTEAETSMLQISEELASVRETLIYACNSTKDKDVDLKILAQQLETKAREMVSVFNTNTAERAIFGGESNSAEPFTLEFDENGYAKQVLYHGVPVNAHEDCNSFPYSDEVYVDIGIGMIVDSDTHTADPQSALKISFNGAQVTGNGSEDNKASIDFESMTVGTEYELNLYVEGKQYDISFKAANNAADSITAFKDACKVVFKRDDQNMPEVSAEGEITIPVKDDDGNPTGELKQVYLGIPKDAENRADIENDYTYSKNYIQITLDAAKALRDGDIEYANACIDRIVSASENLLVEIADLGNNEEFIEFNTSRLETRELNLKDRQETLEATDLESEITLLKTYEALYNACLQMSSSVVPNTIFNYIR